MRIGIGYDVHCLVENRDLIIGGVNIPHSLGLQGHSDADVLIHAICDAILGAAALRDIGFYFPDTDKKYKNIDSKELLKKTIEIVEKEGYTIGNIDSIVCAQEPKINPYILQMKECLARILNISENEIGIKATTTEKLGFVGRKEGISAQAVVILNSKKQNPYE